MRFEEDDLLMQCVAWCDGYFACKFPNLRVRQTDSRGVTRLVSPLVHTRNEKKRTPQAGLRDKHKGVRAGYPDLVLHIQRGTSPCLVGELKRNDKKAVLSKNQKHWQEYFESIGAEFHVCRTIQQFQKIIINYMEGK